MTTQPRAAGGFPKRPERYYRGKTVLVNGVITMYEGSAQTFLVYRSRIWVE